MAKSGSATGMQASVQQDEATLVFEVELNRSVTSDTVDRMDIPNQTRHGVSPWANPQC